MKSVARDGSVFEFCFPRLDTLVLVETHGDGIAIRATRDTFSAARKEAFVRELAAEGFIPAEYRWAPASSSSLCPIRWSIDFTWLGTRTADAAIARRFMLRLLAGSATLWLVLIALLFVHGF